MAPDLDEIMKILDLLQADEDHWSRIMTIARQAQEHGWWEKFEKEMGPRQALYANLEAGAAAISEYHMTFLPGLLQTPPYTEARLRADRSGQFDPTRALDARATRARMVRRPGGPCYDVVIDELAVRRLAAPPDVVRAQLDHLIDVGHDWEKVTIRILPLAVDIAKHVPRSAFYTYRYPDPDDPVVVAVDTVTSDLVLTDRAEVDRYIALYQRLQQAALSPADSLDFLATVAEELYHRPGG